MLHNHIVLRYLSLLVQRVTIVIIYFGDYTLSVLAVK